MINSLFLQAERARTAEPSSEYRSFPGLDDIALHYHCNKSDPIANRI